VLFRNQLIYFNQLLQDKTLNAVHSSLAPGGYLVLGAKETLENTNSNNKFTVVNDSEKIYKKKVG
jgi:chemotaxis protein methyltransferase CheR